MIHKLRNYHKFYKQKEFASQFIINKMNWQAHSLVKNKKNWQPNSFYYE